MELNLSELEDFEGDFKKLHHHRATGDGNISVFLELNRTEWNQYINDSSYCFYLKPICEMQSLEETIYMERQLKTGRLKYRIIQLLTEQIILNYENNQWVQ